MMPNIQCLSSTVGTWVTRNPELFHVVREQCEKVPNTVALSKRNKQQAPVPAHWWRWMHCYYNITKLCPQNWTENYISTCCAYCSLLIVPSSKVLIIRSHCKAKLWAHSLFINQVIKINILKKKDISTLIHFIVCYMTGLISPSLVK